MTRRVLALFFATLVAACATARETPTPLANDNDRCDDLEKRTETEDRPGASSDDAYHCKSHVPRRGVSSARASSANTFVLWNVRVFLSITTTSAPSCFEESIFSA